MARTRRLPVSIAGAAALLFTQATLAAEPVRHIGIYVQPYYEAAREPGGTPRVAVGGSFDALASNRREDILALRDKIAADPKERAYLSNAANVAKLRAERVKTAWTRSSAGSSRLDVEADQTGSGVLSATAKRRAASRTTMRWRPLSTRPAVSHALMMRLTVCRVVPVISAIS